MSQKGGVARRATYIKEVSEVDSASVLKVDCGDLISGVNNLAPIKAKYLFEAYAKMGYDCVNLGESDLDQGQAFLLEMVRTYGVPVISANVFDGTTGERFLPPYIIKRIGGKKFLGFEWGGVRVGVFGVLELLDDNSILPAMEGEDRLVIRDPIIAGREIVEELNDKCDLIICLAHTGWIQAKDLARGVAGIDLMVVGHGANVKPKPYLVGETPMVMPGDQGKYLGIVTLALDERGIVTKRDGRAQPLDETVQDDADMVELVKRYRVDLNEAGKAYVPETSDLEDLRFVGSSACGECHEAEFKQWRLTSHSRAIETLRTRDQDHNPECVPCHVTGYGHFNGFHSYEKTPNMVSVGCEVCHGSGADHIAYVNGESMENARAKPDRSYTLAPVVDRCVACHNSRHDPTFDFDEKIGLVDHSVKKR